MQYRHRTIPGRRVTVISRSFGSVSYVATGTSIVSNLPAKVFDRNFEPASPPIAGIPAQPKEQP